MTLAEVLITDFEGEAGNTRNVLAAVPGDRLEWRPHEKSKSLGELAGHIAEAPGWTKTILGADLDFAVADRGYVPFVPTGSADLMRAFADGLDEFKDLVRGRDDSYLNQVWTMRHADKILMQAPRHVALRSTTIHHPIHHRGQLTVYLRLLDIPVPGTYGPTADHSNMFS